MNKYAYIGAALLGVALWTSCASAPVEPTNPDDPEDQILSDQDLIDYSQSDFDAAVQMNQEFILGIHEGTPVKVSFPCSDLCPDNTKRIISYDVDLENCPVDTGMILSINVPVAITVVPQDFCVPKVLVLE